MMRDGVNAGDQTSHLGPFVRKLNTLELSHCRLQCCSASCMYVVVFRSHPMGNMCLRPSFSTSTGPSLHTVYSPNQTRPSPRQTSLLLNSEETAGWSMNTLISPRPKCFVPFQSPSPFNLNSASAPDNVPASHAFCIIRLAFFILAHSRGHWANMTGAVTTEAISSPHLLEDRICPPHHPLYISISSYQRQYQGAS